MKLSGITWIVIGLCLGLSVLSLALFQVYLPNEEAARYIADYKQKCEDQAALQPQAENRVRQAIQMVSQAAADWNMYVATKTPADNLAGGGINVYENPYQLVVDSPKFRNSAQRALNAQLRVGGVKVVSAPDVPTPTDSESEILASYYNFPAYSYPVVLWELGSVTVQGTYDQITRNVRAWSNMPHYLAVVDGLQLSGTSPLLTGTYNVTIVGFIRANQVFPGPPGASVAAAGQQGGGPGGPGGGMIRPGGPAASGGGNMPRPGAPGSK